MIQKQTRLILLWSMFLFALITTPTWGQCTDCASGNSVSLMVNEPGVFSGGGLNGSTSSPFTLFGATGGNDFFTGAIFSTDALPTTDLAELCMLIDIDVQTDMDLAANPITFEFRIENICGGFPCPWVDFNTVINGTGPTTVGGTLSTGNNTGFDPTQPFQVVIAYANFSGTPLPNDVTINYSLPTFDACAAAPAVSCAPCPAGFVSESLVVDDPAFFQGGDLNGSVPNNTTLFGASGSNNFFIGSTFGTESLPFTNINDLCMLIDIDVVTDIDLVANPITFEFRIENLCGGFPCPWVDFNTVVTEAGPATIGGNFTMGNNTGFNPTQPYQIVIAFANFGTALTNDISINYSQPVFTACVPESVCSLTSITATDQEDCNPGDNTFAQTLVIEYVDPPSTGALNVNGNFFPITGSPQTVTLSGLSSTGVGVDVSASFTDDVLCILTVADAFTAPSPCVDFPTDADGICSVLYENDIESTNFNQNNLFGFGGDFGGQNFGITDNLQDGGIAIFLSSTAGNPYFYVGLVQQISITGGIASYGALTLSADMSFNQLGNVEFRIESLDALGGNVTGVSANFLLPVQSVGNYDTYTFNPLNDPGTLDLTSNFYQIVIAATDGGFGNDDFFEMFVDNLSFTNCEVTGLDITREGALCAEPSLPTDGDEVYTWYDADGNVVAIFNGNGCYSPSELGSYYVIVTDPDYPGVQQVFDPRTITELNGCCELED